MLSRLLLPIFAIAESLPNVVFILADDMDAHSDLDKYMPNLNKYFIEGGTKFDNHFVTTPLCCPSRASILRGQGIMHFHHQVTHNHNLTDTQAPHGGYVKFRKNNLDSSYMPSWMQSAGYSTYFSGKFLVEYSVRDAKPEGEKTNQPLGWNDFDAAVFPFTFDYERPVFSRNGGVPKLYPNQYWADVHAAKVKAQLQDGISKKKPFFAFVAPIGCHTNLHPHILPNGKTVFPGVTFSPPIPANRHANMFPGLVLPNRLNSPELDRSDKPAWIRALGEQTAQNKTFLNNIYRQRVLSLQSVDELIGDIFNQLEIAGQLNNTIVVFTSDNGYHLGNHNMMAGKMTCYEEDIKVPFYATGPGIAKDLVKKTHTSHIDIAPTFARIAGTPIPDFVDGTIIPLFQDEKKNRDFTSPRPPRTDVHGIEFWGIRLFEAPTKGFNPTHWGTTTNKNNRFTWKSVRVCEEKKETCYKYVVYCNGEKELYDLKSDPFEMENLLPSLLNSTIEIGYSPIPDRLSKLVDRLDATLSAAATCKGIQCINPLSMLHPENSSITFSSALNPIFDAQYARYKKFRFTQCTSIFQPETEISFGRMAVPVVPDSGAPQGGVPVDSNYTTSTVVEVPRTAMDLGIIFDILKIDIEGLLSFTRPQH